MSGEDQKRITNELSVTRWFHRLIDGDEVAAEALWRYYFPQLLKLARRHVIPGEKLHDVAEDAASSAIRIMIRGASQGRYQNVQNRDELWRLLVVATKRKVLDRLRAQQTQKRGGGAVLQPLDESIAAFTLTPEMLAILDEDLQELLGLLRDDGLRRIAMLRLEGYENREIARMLDVSERTIERKLHLIRTDWEKRAGDSKD
ncbi:MAG: sigma-70 family RNA polymerase sigma factor [Pirellulaceae bacterium]